MAGGLRRLSMQTNEAFSGRECSRLNFQGFKHSTFGRRKYSNVWQEGRGKNVWQRVVAFKFSG